MEEIRMDLEPFPDWRNVCPELEVLKDNGGTIAAELSAVLDSPGWFDWVQKDLYESDGDWSVFTLFGFDKINLESVERLPRTCALLAQIPSLKTAIFSRLAPYSAI